METNAIYEGDNLEILNKFSDKSIDLIYADPPFFSNKQYEVIWKDKAEVMSFEDRWEGGIEHYITWMEPRLRECYRVLKSSGSMYLHCDYHANAHLRILMDKIFGENHFLNEIIWSYKRYTASSKRFQRLHDTILFYTKGDSNTFNEIRDEYGAKSGIADSHYKQDEEGKWYRWQKRKGKEPYKIFLSEGKRVGDVWEIPIINASAKERLGYPTQKPLALLDQIIKASSNKGDIVLDPFCGCGTAIISAQKLGRRWIGIDVSPTACKLMVKRMKHECGINAQLIHGIVDLNYIKKLAHFDFQNWVVVDKFLGAVNPKKSGDKGIDGHTAQVLGGFPIQVKQSESIGSPEIRLFETDMRTDGKTKGYFVALSFNKGAREEVARAKNQEGLEIILRTAQDLLDGKID